MSKVLGVGVIGCGNISAAYFGLAPLFKGLEIRACADVNMKAAKARAKEFKIKAQSVGNLLKNPDIDVVVNLTVPAAHYPVSMKALRAGKHVYSEKPLVLSLKEGLALKKLADEKGLKVGCAPDTFLGGAHQQARKAIDDGKVGAITSGTAHVMNFGMEHWHPNPDFFYLPGGGPILDLGPYYVANLINLIGPVKRVVALATMPQKSRKIVSEPRKGEEVPVKTPTNIHALLEFANGATVTLSASWDVFAHRHANMELYGSEGSIYVPDPNFFGGEVLATKRTAGLADMAVGILESRDYRCSLDRTLHGIEIMTGILKSGETGKFVEMKTICTRPAALGPKEAKALLK
jgi:predicted dehydrogenase